MPQRVSPRTPRLLGGGRGASLETPKTQTWKQGVKRRNNSKPVECATLRQVRPLLKPARFLPQRHIPLHVAWGNCRGLQRSLYLQAVYGMACQPLAMQLVLRMLPYSARNYLQHDSITAPDAWRREALHYVQGHLLVASMHCKL